MAARVPVKQRLEAKTVRDGDCLVWTGAKRPGGYGVIGTGEGKKVDSVHRVAYILANGSIPERLHIDHLCGNRACVQPTHLEAVTQAENNRRANKKRFEAMTHCRRGHEFDEQNTMWQKNGEYRLCRMCHNLTNRAQRRGMSIEEYLMVLDPKTVTA